MQDQAPWGDCPSGVMSDMVAQLRRRKRQTQVRAAVSIGLAVLLVATVGYGLAGRDAANPRAKMNCSEAVPLFAKYHDQSLDAAVAEDVREHLSRCPACRKHYADLFPSEAQIRSSTGDTPLALATHFRR